MADLSREQWQQLEPLLDELLELDESTRSARLAALDAESPALASAVMALFAAEARVPLDDDARSMEAAREALSLPGAAIGPYRLIRSLGYGGMGSVWLATRADGRFAGQVAIKFLNLAMLEEAADRRFQREGSVLARLTHPAIARLLDAGVNPAGQPYLVLEYVDGQQIDRYCDERRLGVAGRIALMLAIMEAVSHAHQNLVVHRDLKPSNILVTSDGQPKLLDFGIAKLLDDDSISRDGADITMAGAQALTPGFAAPEQVAGGTITTATDVYALGILLHLLLSGEHPTGAGAANSAEALRSVLERNPVRLSEAAAANAKHPRGSELAELRGASPERLRREYRGDLENILAKTLKKDPIERYPSVTAFATDLRRYLDHEPVSARPDSTMYRFARFARRHRVGMAITALVALSLVSSAAFSIREMHEAQRQRDEALYHAKRADAQIEFQTLLVSDIGDRPMTMREILDRGRELLIRQHPGDPRFQAAIITQFSTAYADLGDSKMRGLLLARAESLSHMLRDSSQLIETKCEQGDNLRTMGKYLDAAAAFAEAEKLLVRSPNAQVEATCLLLRVNFDYEAASSDSALSHANRAMAIYRRLGDSTSLEYISGLQALGAALESRNRLIESRAVSLQVLEAMDRSGRGDLMSRTVYLHNLGVVLRKLGRTAQAETVFHDVLVRAKKADPSQRLPTQVLIHYAAAALYQHHADSAARYYDMLATQAVADTNRYWEGRARFGLALAQLQLGQTAAARASMRRFAAIAKTQNLSSSDDELYDARVLDARVLDAERRHGEARSLLMDALNAAGYTSGKKRSIFRSALLAAAAAALQDGASTDALSLIRATRALVDRDTSAKDANAYVGETWLLEARALTAARDSAGARAAIVRARRALLSGAGAAHPLTAEAIALAKALGVP